MVEEGGRRKARGARSEQRRRRDRGSVMRGRGRILDINSEGSGELSPTSE